MKRFHSIKRSLSVKTSDKRPAISVPQSMELKLPVTDFAFAFDVDGVLIESGQVLELARRTLKVLHDLKIPFIIITNGGGRPDEFRARILSERLRVPVSVDNFVQSHTPFHDLVPKYQDKCVLVLGGIGNLAREAAYSYGFRKVIIAADIVANIPDYWEYGEIAKDSNYYQKHAQPLPTRIDWGNLENHDNLTAAKSLKIDAVFVMNNSRDYSLDIQIVLDLLLSFQGFFGTTSKKNGNQSLPNDGYQQDGQPDLYFANTDVVTASFYHHPRLASGAFKAALEGVWKEGKRSQVSLLNTHLYGKPHQSAFLFAEERLLIHRLKVLTSGPIERVVNPMPQLQRVYMVGDNPDSDIKGANEFRSAHNIQWLSLLVETGVFSSRAGAPPKYKPTHIAKHVSDAVVFALKREGFFDSTGKRWMLTRP